MEIENETEYEGIPRDNTNGNNNLDVTRQDTNGRENSTTRSNMESDENTTRHNPTKQNTNGCENSTTRSNMESHENTTRCNFTVVESSTSSNEILNDDTTSSNNDAKVENPYELEMDGDDDVILDDLGPELAKMGRILTREITKSLSKALIPLQKEINDLKETQNSTLPINDMHDIIEENDRLRTKVD